jgi:hypothetical protein
MDQTESDQAALRHWWMPRTVPEGSTLDGWLGPLRLQIHHAPGEWHVEATPGEETGQVEQAVLMLREGPIDGDAYERFMVTRRHDQLRLVPLLADRPVVIRPRQPVFLPPGEETTLYMSSPIYVRIEAGDPPMVLRETPTVRLSDTWFGASTREGDLCYSGRTHARHVLAEVPRRPYRAITPAHVRNRADTVLALDKLSLPVPALSVYGSDDGALWTESVSLIRAADSDLAELHIDPGPPEFAGAVQRISGPRRSQSRGGLVRAFSALFGGSP